MLKVLFIGGTGQISSAIVRRLAADENYDVWLLNRGNNPAPEGTHQITVDVNDEAAVAEAVKDYTFDTVCEFIGFVKKHNVEVSLSDFPKIIQEAKAAGLIK